MAKFIKITSIDEVADAVVSILEETQPDAVRGFVVQMANFAYELWTMEARNASSWGDRYASTITMDIPSAGKSVSEDSVYVDESHPNFMFVNIMENGMKSFSIKDALLAGKAARRNKAKYGTVFVHVPFRWRTPKDDQSKTHSTFSGMLSDDIYEIAKGGGRVTVDMAKSVRNKNLAGLKRFGGDGHGQYLTFRTVSEKSQGWKHPGAPATPVYRKVEQLVNDRVEKELLSFLEGRMDGIAEALRGATR